MRKSLKNLIKNFYFFLKKMISIEGIDKIDLLYSLWYNQKPAIFFSLYDIEASVFDKKLARNAICNYIDYFCGRCIKCDLSGDEVDPYLYDRDAGTGKFLEICNKLRSKSKI